MGNSVLKLVLGLAILSELDATPLNSSIPQGESTAPFESAAIVASNDETGLGNVSIELSTANTDSDVFVQPVQVKMVMGEDHEVRVRFAETDIEAEGAEGKQMDTQIASVEEDLKKTPSNNDAAEAEAQSPIESEDEDEKDEDDDKDLASQPAQVELETSSSIPQMEAEEDQKPQAAIENLAPDQGENEETSVDKPPPDGTTSPAGETPIEDKLTEADLEEVQNQDQNEEATAIPQLTGAATHHRPIENNESEMLEGRNDNVDDGDDGFVKVDDVISLKDNVITSVLEAEVVTDNFDCSENRGPLRHMSAGSKHFVDVAKLYNFMEAREVCSKYNLVISEVEGLGDHRTMEGFMTANKYYDAKGSSGGGSFFIGLNDIKTEGVFRHANGKNVTYQNFLSSQPDDRNETEDCVVITKEKREGPSGAADYDCNKTAHVFCMFQVNSQCYNDSKETFENRKLETERTLHLLVNASERAYFISNYQATWKEAMKQCEAKQMKLFNMDGVVTMGFFRSILRWDNIFYRTRMPTVQYWTSGKFQKSHMTAPIIWHTKPELTDSEERGVEKHNSTFSFSGLYHWSTEKKVDPGGPHGWRRDLCVSFGLDKKPEAIPFIRNTNCDLPNYFICYVEYPDVSDEDEGGKGPTTEVPFGPGDKPFPPDAVNETEIEEIEKEMENEGRFLNVSDCDTKDEDPIVGRNGIVGERYRWTYSDGFVVYIDPSYSKSSRKLINAAMDKLRRVVCIPFYLFRRNQRPYGNYVHIRNAGGCNSDVGRIGRGAQEMSLANHCLRLSIIMHEMIHALGFWHEQSRPDRDKYVTILWDNIRQNARYNFNKMEGTNTFGVPYNPISIMHYAGTRHSANGRPTIVAKNGGPVGTQGILQPTDIQKLRKMYRCD